VGSFFWNLEKWSSPCVQPEHAVLVRFPEGECGILDLVFALRTNIPEKLLAIVHEIDASGSANLTRLTVIKKWFDRPERLSAFGLWIARRACGRIGKTKGKAGALLKEAHNILGTTATRDAFLTRPDRVSAKSLHERARGFHNEFKGGAWGPVRIIHCWPLLLVEKGLAIYLGLSDTAPDGYKLASDFCQHYDSRYGNSLNGPSRT
jgi:hypothetical protein